MSSSLAADRTRVADLEAQILQSGESLADLGLQCSIPALRSEKQLVLERLAAYKYPVLELPTEITSKIFLHTLPVYPDYPPLLGPDSPTLLAQICHQWREIAVATPELWSVISFNNLDDPPFPHRLHLGQLWLARSHSYPLAIRFRRVGVLEEMQVLEAIIPHRARWECLDVHLHRPSHFRITVLEDPMPLLRHLDLILDRANVVITFSQVPLLRSVTLRAETPSKIAFPMGQLTSLRLPLALRRDYVAILQQTCNLVHCELGVFSEWDGDSDLPPEHAIELPWLKSLILSLDTNAPPTGYLDDFLVPALCSIRLDELFLSPEPIDRLSAFISKSGCQLQDVCVTERRALSKASYLEGFPFIPQFSFEDAPDTPSISTESSESESFESEASESKSSESSQ